MTADAMLFAGLAHTSNLPRNSVPPCEPRPNALVRRISHGATEARRK